MADEPSTTPPSVTPDNIATKLGGAAIPEGYVPFRGYFAAGDDGTCRIVLDEQFLRWLVVSTDDVAARLDVPADAQDPRDLIWVRRGARMTKCEVAYAPEIADAGWGVDTESTDAGPWSDDEPVDDVSRGPKRRGRLARRGPPPPPY